MSEVPRRATEQSRMGGWRRGRVERTEREMAIHVFNDTPRSHTPCHSPATDLLVDPPRLTQDKRQQLCLLLGGEFCFGRPSDLSFDADVLRPGCAGIGMAGARSAGTSCRDEADFGVRGPRNGLTSPATCWALVFALHGSTLAREHRGQRTGERIGGDPGVLRRVGASGDEVDGDIRAPGDSLGSLLPRPVQIVALIQGERVGGNYRRADGGAHGATTGVLACQSVVLDARGLCAVHVRASHAGCVIHQACRPRLTGTAVLGSRGVVYYTPGWKSRCKQEEIHRNRYINVTRVCTYPGHVFQESRDLVFLSAHSAQRGTRPPFGPPRGQQVAKGGLLFVQ